MLTKPTRHGAETSYIPFSTLTRHDASQHRRCSSRSGAAKSSFAKLVRKVFDDKSPGIEYIGLTRRDDHARNEYHCSVMLFLFFSFSTLQTPEITSPSFPFYAFPAISKCGPHSQTDWRLLEAFGIPRSGMRDQDSIGVEEFLFLSLSPVPSSVILS